MNRLILSTLFLVVFSSCGFANNSESGEVLNEDNLTEDQINEEKIHQTHQFGQVLLPQILDLEDADLEKAFLDFYEAGVPKIPLEQVIKFYKLNRMSKGGLKDSSCLLVPMSESGDISKDDRRWDPTTISELKKGIQNERYIVMVDYTKSKKNPRVYILDMKADEKGRYHFKETTASHGYGSREKKGIPQIFTNEEGHGTTVSGFHLTAKNNYQFIGRSKAHGKYRSIGLRLYGVESTNNTAESSSKVSHGAPYNTKIRTGNSAGCPAMTQEKAKEFLPNLRGGALWYHYTIINKDKGYKSPSCKSIAPPV